MANGSRKPKLYVIAGPNGAGKTTFAREFLPNQMGCLEFVNADLIAGGLSPLAPEAAAIQAGRLMLQQIRSLADQRKTFGFETTLAGRTYLKLFTDLKRRGYEVHVVFLWLPSVAVALDRVAERVRKGGHNVPAAVVRRRFRKGIHNLLRTYRSIWDSISLFDNSGATARLIFEERAGMQTVHDAGSYENILRMA